MKRSALKNLATRWWLLATLVVLFMAFPAVAHEAKAPPCTVTPNPVSLSTDLTWTVTALGGAQGVLYEINLKEGGVPRQDEGTSILYTYADSAGVVTGTFDVLDYRLFPYSNFYPSLIPGTANITIKKSRQGGGTDSGQAGTLATCSFGVTE